MAMLSIFNIINFILLILLILLLVLLIILSTKGIKALDLYISDKNSYKNHPMNLSSAKVTSKISESDNDI